MNAQANPGLVVWMRNPFVPSDRQVLEVFGSPTIAQWLEAGCIVLDQPTLILRNGHPVLMHERAGLHKTPICGHTTARSEADKRLWHKRWRASERDQISKVGADTDHVAGHRNAVSSTCDMAKDGKAWFDLSHQREIAERIAARHARLLPERKPFRRGC
jgi:hypothetical protein